MGRNKKMYRGERIFFRLKYPNLPIVSSIVSLVISIIALVIQYTK